MFREKPKLYLTVYSLPCSWTAQARSEARIQKLPQGWFLLLLLRSGSKSNLSAQLADTHLHL